MFIALIKSFSFTNLRTCRKMTWREFKESAFYKMEREKWLAEKYMYIFVIFYSSEIIEIFNWCIYCVVWFVYFSVWDCNMHILSEMYFSLYFIILDQYLLILFVNINIFYLLKRAFNKSNWNVQISSWVPCSTL